MTRTSTSSPSLIQRALVARPSAAEPWDPGISLLVGVLVLTILEGAARKWLFAEKPGLRYAVYFSKDALFLCAAYLGARRQQRFALPWFGLCAGLVILPSLFGTLAHSNAVGIALSVRAYLIVPLCAFLCVPLVRSFADIERCAKIVALATLLMAPLGVIQYRLPPGHWLNRMDSGGEESLGVSNSGYVRASGTYAYLAGMTVMAGLGGWAGTLLALPLPGRRKTLRQFGFVVIGAALVCALVSMSRSALLVWGVCVVGAFALFWGMSRALIACIGVATVVVAVGLASPKEQLEATSGPDSITVGMMNRIRHSDTFSERLSMVLDELWLGVSQYTLGEGLGLGQPGGMYASYGARVNGGTEFEWGRIAFEVGVAGLLGALLIRIVPGVICWRTLLVARDPVQRAIIATALPFFGIMALGNMAFNHTGNSAAWAVMTFALAAVPSTRRSHSYS
jgi:hypothetical protein